ncbi:MAG: hypothetical protein A2583_05230 [Bdellovibrionales bacterium RIFOXYD1_FULL_53_11]|nr:MAG: hypothetical protein A2583_05230 [Bdellovibrionales bacterium RIFOXYD1_FULL_53_11]
MHGQTMKLPFAEPSPLGLFGLAIGCGALIPIAFGYSVSVQALNTAAIICLVFGGGCQLLSGIMSFVNGNLYGGTLFTTFSFNWALNYWILKSLAAGVVPDHSVIFSMEIVFFVIFVVLTYGFGFFSGLLFAFLLNIDLLYAAKIINAVAPGTAVLKYSIAGLTVLLAVLSLWLAFAIMINPVAGRKIFPMPGPLFRKK